MHFPRKPADHVTPTYEDKGIFKKEVVRIAVKAVPQFGQNSRGDIIVKGFVLGDGAIDLIFPGRRKIHAYKLKDHIQTQWTRARTLARQSGKELQVEDFKCHIEVEGSWRARFNRDEQGMQTRNHQLYAARWVFRDADGITVFSGEPVVK